MHNAEIREPRRGALIAVIDGKTVADAKLRANGFWRVNCRIANPWVSIRTIAGPLMTGVKFVSTKAEAIALLDECASHTEAA